MRHTGSAGRRMVPAAIVAGALGLYASTAAPGLLWGDPGKFQRMAWELELRFDETGHPLWVLLAHPLTRVPGLDPALACNLLSSLLSALALWPAFRVMRRLGASQAGSSIACLALAVSHTFWFHAVVAEVYALNSLVTLILLDLTLRALDGAAGPPLRWRGWLAAGLACGLAAGNHHLVLLWLPGFAWYLHRAVRSGRAGRAAALGAAFGLAAGLAPFLLLLAAAPGGGASIADLAAGLAARMLHPSDLARDAALFAGYLLYQFPIPIVLAAAAAGAMRARRDMAAGLLLIYAANVIFAFGLRVNDRYAFYLPSYLVVAVMAGPGLDALLHRLNRAARAPAALAVVAAACVLAPPALYRAASRFAGEAALAGGLPVRDLAYRDEARFHLDPSKRGEDGARRFCEEAFAVLPRRAVLLADFTLAEPLTYLQVVEGIRPDVQVFYAAPHRQLQVALASGRQARDVFLAAADAYYNVEDLSTRFEVRPAGPIYRLIPR